MQYIVNVESCIQQENYQIFFYEPTAKHQIELFDTKWNVEALADVFSQVAAHINRREFEESDNQVVVCVRVRPDIRHHRNGVTQTWHETSLYAKTLVARALEQSTQTSILTSSYTRKVKLVFQSEQEYFGSVEQMSSVKEEQMGLLCFLSDLQSACDANGTSLALVDSFGLPMAYTPTEWEHTLFEALTCAKEKQDETGWLRKRLLSVMEEEKALDEKQKRMQEDELPETNNLQVTEEAEKTDTQGEYISHRIRSLIDGSKIGRVCECLYWPVAAKSSQANTIAMLGLTEILCTKKEITRENIQPYLTQKDPYLGNRLQNHFASILAGYRYQLENKRQQLLAEIGAKRSGFFEEKESHRLDQTAESTIPSAPEEFREHLETIKMQLAACKLSLHEKTAHFGRRNEMKERISQAAEILVQSIDGLEIELVSYQKTAASFLYRQIEQVECVDASNAHVRADHFGTKKKDENKTEASAKKLIETWKNDMSFLVNCANLTGFLPAFLYLCGCLAATGGLYFLLHDTKNVQSVYAGLCAMAVIGIILVGGSFCISSYFIREIQESYDELQKRIEEVLDEYQFRAKDYEESVNLWLNELNRQQQSIEKKQAHMDERKQIAQRSWHLTNLNRILSSLALFGLERSNAFEKENENMTIAARIVQPMDYQQKEIGNEIYWPVWAEEGGENE